MTIREALQKQSVRLIKRLRNRTQAWFEVELLLSHVLRTDRAHLVAHSSDRLLPIKYRSFAALIERRLKKEPIAYLLKQAPFYHQLFFVDPRVLIPRPETEWLVEQSLKILHQTSSLVWEVGTGSGAIALSIKKNSPQTQIIASDISKDALVVAKRNAKRLSINGVRFIQGSLLTARIKTLLKKSHASSFLMIANLPYLPLKDKRTMQIQIIRYEPISALFAKEQGSFLIKQLFTQLQIFRQEDIRPIHLLIECDPPQAIPLHCMAHKVFPDYQTTIYRDFNRKERFLEIHG